MRDGDAARTRRRGARGRARRAAAPHARARHDRLRIRLRIAGRARCGSREATVSSDLVLAHAAGESAGAKAPDGDRVRRARGRSGLPAQMTIAPRFPDASPAARSALRGLACLRAPRCRPPARKLLILVELKGGNDGLNTVVPYADPAYAAAAPAHRHRARPGREAHEHAALHPSLEKLHADLGGAASSRSCRAWAIRDPNLSHFRSIEIWDTASTERGIPRGRAGSRARSRTRRRRAALRRRRRRRSARRAWDRSPARRARHRAHQPRAVPAQRAPRARCRARRATPRSRTSCASSARSCASAEKLHAGPRVRDDIPDRARSATPSAHRRAARREPGRHRGDPRDARTASTRTRTSWATHANLLRQLGEGLAALARGAGRGRTAGTPTVVATYSEFGRRAAREPERRHRTTAPRASHFVMGGRRQGRALRRSAARSTASTATATCPFAVDFRGYYATFLERWWGIDSQRASWAGASDRLEFI